MKICVTGGSGFVGSNLIQDLSSEFEVVNIDRRQSPYFPDITIVSDIRNLAELNKALHKADLVIHLAAEHRDDITPVNLYYDVNVDGTRILLETMVQNNVKSIIFTSTVAIYGLNKKMPDEHFVPTPFNHYGKSKWQAEEVIKKWQEEDPSRAALIIRPTVIFGERNRGNVYNLFKQIASGRFVKIGSGHNRKSLAYVGNVTAFIMHFIHRGFTGCNIYNYVDKPDLTINELVNIITKKLSKKIPPVSLPFALGMAAGYSFDFFAFLTRKPFPISSVRVRKFCANTQFESSKALSSGFTPVYKIPEAIEKTLEFEFLSDKIDNVSFITE